MNYSIPIPTSPFVNIKTGLVDRQWYQFLTNIFSAQGGGAIGTVNQVLHGNNAGYEAVDLTADVTGVLPLANTSTITNAKLAQMAGHTYKGNNTGVASNPLDLSIAQVQTDLAIPAQTIAAWTPADNSGAGLSFTSVSASSTQHGNLVFAYATLVYPATADGSSASISGLPITVANAGYAQTPSLAANTATLALTLVPIRATKTASFFLSTAFSAVTNAQLSGATINFLLIYPVA